VDVIREHWHEVVRLVASLKAGTVAPSAMLRKLAAYERQNHLDLALQELGRIERTLFREQVPFGRQIQAEAAFSVETEHRRRGIGEKLFRRIQRAATNHGVETIEIICLPDNIGVRMLAQKFKTDFTFEENALTGRLRAWRPTAFSLMREASGDVLDFCAALFDAQWRAFHDVQARGA